MKNNKYWHGVLFVVNGRLIKPNKKRPVRKFYIDHIERKQLREDNR